MYVFIGLEDGVVLWGGVVFLSQDLKHDRHQVEVFHKKLLQYLKDHYRFEVKAEFRYSDQCAQQFKSQYTIHDLVSTLPGHVIHWVFYEVGEGKNSSDLLGALFKLAYTRAVATSDPTTASAQSITEIIQLTRGKLAESSKKFDFIEMIEVQPFTRPRPEDEMGVVVKAIQKQHHFTRTPAGELVARKIPCTACIMAGLHLCVTCEAVGKVTVKAVPRKMIIEKDGELDNPEVEVESAGEEDGGASDASDVEENEEETGLEDEEDEDLVPGSIVWARVQRYHPAQVLSPSEVSSSLTKLLSKAKVPSLFVKRFGLNDIKLVPVNRVQTLGSNKVDRQRAGRTPEIREAYDMALAVLLSDI